MDTNQTVQGQIALVTEEPYRISLKAERVQEPSALVVDPDAAPSPAFTLNLELSQKQPVKIELTALGTIVTI